MKQSVKWAFGLWLCCASTGFAESQQGVVVELYTSQGCSSCPPADDHFASFVQTPGVIALALHVDYWDYIGWTDTFASPKYTKRQKAYAHAEGSKMIYTPQVIVNGTERVVGNQAASVESAIKQSVALTSPVTLTLVRQGDKVVIHAEARQPLRDGTRIQLVRYTPEKTVQIERGENAGRAVTYHNIVTSWEDIGAWTGDQPLDMSTKAVGGAPIVVIIQTDGPSTILAAARIE